MYVHVKWNTFGRGLLASGLAIKARRASPWPLPERRPEASRLGRSGGSGRDLSLGEPRLNGILENASEGPDPSKR